MPVVAATAGPTRLRPCQRQLQNLPDGLRFVEDHPLSLIHI